eukprot:4160961-Pleurochrysis_carterae.AAC.2
MTLCAVPRLEVASGTNPAPTRAYAPRTDPWQRRGYGRGGSRGSVRGGGRGSPQATAPFPISPKSGKCQPLNGRPVT